MNLKSEIISIHKEMITWRHDLHAHPEIAFEEARTAKFVSHKLDSWGITVSQPVGKTGVVGTLRVGHSEKAIGLRADMDALPMEELNTFSYKSIYPGRMHACGHDGHTVMLLGAAYYLAKTKKFDGTVQFYFQPAEEANDRGSGAKAMIDDGLFKRFPADSVFGLHNWAIPVGAVLTLPGPLSASMDLFEVTLKGQGTHGAMPHTGKDTLLVAAHLLTAWQSIVSRNLDPKEAAVLSATSIESGSSWNVIPETVVIRGSVRAIESDIQHKIKERFYALTESIAAAFGCKVQIDYRHMTPSMINDAEETKFLKSVACEVVGESKVIEEGGPSSMGSEDFAFMLNERPGCFFLLGTGSEPGKSLIHEPSYDFNDEILPIGASLFSRLVERKLSITS